MRKGARNVSDTSWKAGADGILGVRVAEIPRVVTRAARRGRRTARFDPRRRWCLPRVAGGKPLLRSGRRDACRGGLSFSQREDRGILHLRRGICFHLRFGLFEGWPFAFALG